MGTLAEAFAKEAAKRKDADISRQICEFAARGLYPFKPGRITLEIESGPVSPNIDTIWVTVERLPAYSFRHKLDRWAMHQAYFPEEYLLQSIGEPLLNHFRYRPSLPVDDHIVLGEE